MEKITYREVNGYMIPNLTLPPEESSVTLGKWGAGVRWTPLQSRSTDRAGRRDMLHKKHLEKHEPILFATLLTQGKLYQHCFEVENQAQQMFDILVKQMKDAEGITEQLKAENQMLWVQKMGNIEAQAREIISKELIYA
ncbi:MAG: TnpV protein [Clostridia bacterium]|nr:TnpV protein [Clostridia bacterium]